MKFVITQNRNRDWGVKLVWSKGPDLLVMRTYKEKYAAIRCARAFGKKIGVDTTIHIKGKGVNEIWRT